MEISIPSAFADLFTPSRYKVYYGGRGSAKSESVARAMLVKGIQKRNVFLCTRELQASIQDSVHRLIAETIIKENLGDQYEVLQSIIRHRTNGSEFIFKGLKHNIAEIKGLQGVDVAWCEEAENISDRSWEYLVPTIRKQNSEIWITFNPRNPTDPTYQRFVATKRDDAIVRKVSWRDNPFFPEVLRKEAEHLKQADPEAYKFIWEGEFDTRKNGCVYARMIDKARRDGRVTRVPYEAGYETFTAWDLGWGDSTAIWWFQVVGREVRVIDYYEANNQPLTHYVEILREKPYSYARVSAYLPHDAAAGNIRGASVTEQLNNMGIRNEVLPLANLESGIELARQLLPVCVFDADKCKDGIWCLENYGYEYDEARNMFKQNPKHDFSSHASDAFRYLAQAITKIKGRMASTETIKAKPSTLSTKSRFDGKRTLR